MNIYQITEELQNIYNELEENGGELTPELEEQLAITQDNLKAKVEDYVNAVKITENECNLIDEEIGRLKMLKESKKKTIERLKKAVVTAVDNYGDTTKSGSKFIDYGLGKVSIRNSSSVEVFDEVTDVTVDNFFNMIDSLRRTGELQHLTEIDCGEAIDMLKQYDNQLNINEDDLKHIQANISFNATLADLINENGLFFMQALLDRTQIKVKSNPDKTSLKTLIGMNVDVSNFAKLNNNKSLIIK